MAERELYYGQAGSMLYEDTFVGWYPAPYNTLALRGALCSQAYVTDDPVNDFEIANKKYVDTVAAGIFFELDGNGDIMPKAA